MRAAACHPPLVGSLALLRRCLAFGAILCAGHGVSLATPFTITGASTTAQTLANNQTGTVTDTGSLTVSGGTVAVTITGNAATLTNAGTIQQTGTGRVIRDNAGVTSLQITNGSATNSTALMQSADADVIQMNKTPASVTLDNYGTMTSLNASKGGAQVVDFAAIQSGANTVNNYTSGKILAQDADAVRPGVNGTLNNWGSITSTTPQNDSGTDGIDAQNNSGVTVNNFSSGSITGARHGLTGGAASALVSFTTTLNNFGTLVGNNGSGVNLDGFNALQTASIVNSGSIIGNGVTGDGDGIDVDGVASITNSGIIRSKNAFAPSGFAQSEGITIGGGTVTNSGLIEGLVAAGNLNAVGRGITLAGNDITSGPLAGTREGLYGNAVITNLTGGVIRGDSDSALAVEGAVSGFTVTLRNDAGALMRGGGATNAAIRTGLDNDTLRNAGTIDGSSSGKAIDLGGGNNRLEILGGSAVVLGSIDGGTGGSNTMLVDPGAGHSFGFDGAISHFIEVDIASGRVTLSGQSDYSGLTRLEGGTLVLDGGHRLAGHGGLALDGGALELLGAAGVDGEAFAFLDLGADGTLDLNGSGLSFDALGDIATGARLFIEGAFGHSLGYALRFLGDWSGNAGLLALVATTSIDGHAAGFRFDGVYTDVFGVVEPTVGTLLAPAFAALVLGTLRRRRHM